jgi:hypothetical protein
MRQAIDVFTAGGIDEWFLEQSKEDHSYLAA